MHRFQEQQHALGSDAILTVLVENQATSASIFTELWSQITRFEATFSRFKDDSELTKVNLQAGERVPVSQAFIALAQVSQDFAAQTDGLYNPFVLPSLQRAGYVGSWPEPAKVTDATNFTDRSLTKHTMLTIGENWVQIPPSAALDFGGIGKGYLLDQLADWLYAQKVTDFWLSLGGDIICSGSDKDKSDWNIGIQKATDGVPAAYVQTNNHRLAIATSGVTKRRGEGWHHIIDPRTGSSAMTNILTATVVTEQAVEADVLAKCAVIVRSEQAATFLTPFKPAGSLLQYTGPKEQLIIESKGVVTTHD